jgi:type VI secretion system secreted protein Hcp
MAQGVNENCFLDMGLKGKATTTGFEGQIVVQSLSYSITQTGEFDEESAKNARITNFSPAVIVKEMDQSSPAISKACAEKKLFPKATITFVDGQNKEYFKVTLEQCQISSVNVGFHSGETKPTETISVDYRKAEWKRGTEVASYDLKLNVAA